MKTLFIPILLLFLVLSIMTLKRNSVWSSEVTLWKDVIVKNGPGSKKVRPHFNIGLALLNEGRWYEAYVELKRTLELYPDYHKAKYYIAEALFRLNRYDEVLICLKEVEYLYEDVLPNFPEKWEGVSMAFSKADLYNNIASCYYYLGRLDQAEQYYKKALMDEPSHLLANEGLITLLIDRKRTSEAIKRLEYLIGIVSKPQDKERLINQLMRLKGG